MHQRSGFGERRKQAKARKRGPEEDQRKAAKKGVTGG